MLGINIGGMAPHVYPPLPWTDLPLVSSGRPIDTVSRVFPEAESPKERCHLSTNLVYWRESGPRTKHCISDRVAGKIDLERPAPLFIALSTPFGAILFWFRKVTSIRLTSSL